MADWGALLEHLTTPRENGTRELAATAHWLSEELGRRGFTAEHFQWTAHPWRLRIIGVVALLAAAGYAMAMLRRRHLVAALITVAVPLYLVAELDFGVPLFGALHSASQEHLIATVNPTEAARAVLVFSAHYDTKTDLLDHVERAPITFLALPLTVLMLVAALRPRPRLTRVALVGAALNGVGLFLVQTAGAFVPTRSPGAVDDGAGCAVLLELASRLKAEPLQHTRVKVVFFSGEELGIEGSQAWVRAQRGELPMRAINLDGVGMSAELSLYRSESGLVRSFAPDPSLVAAVEKVTPLYRPFYPATTDARAFLEAGIPALNLTSERPGHALPRGMHSKADAPQTVSLEGLDHTLAVLHQVARALDAER
ncbi:MAG: M20/M25/M40 family metallo-hydrolase [Archangiaceae bacterium]|nr:M20/M25/M40 family metallo-hydrolase [Archangiaceae bacterium]